jgi:putative tricarboxylic transport membrane protein
MPKSAATELGPEQWPQLILGALIILLFVNMYKIYKSTPAEEQNFKAVTSISIKAMVKSKLFIGIVLIFAYAFALEPAGFILSTLILFATYAKLNGEKRIKVLALTTILITFGVYFIFARGLGIMLPRGYGILRDLALLLESF